MKKAIITFLALSMAASFSLISYAEQESSAESDLDSDVTASTKEWTVGEANQYSETMSEEEQEELEALLNLDNVKLSFDDTKEADITYDEETSMYVYTLPNEFKFYISVPGGAASVDPVRMRIEDKTSNVTVTKDGEEYEVANGTYYFSEPGLYQLDMVCKPGSYTGDNITIYNYQIVFQVLNDGYSRQNFLLAPEGYEIKYVACSGKPIEITNSKCIYIPDDGNYQVRCSADNLPDYSMTFKKDTKAPTLTFSQPIKQRALKLPVSYEKTDEEDTITVYRDGNSVELQSQTLNQGGHYRIRVTDKAGNNRDYQFFVKETYKLFNKHLVILIVIVALGGIFVSRSTGFEFRRRDY